jgi:hypothetical protein
MREDSDFVYEQAALLAALLPIRQHMNKHVGSIRDDQYLLCGPTIAGGLLCPGSEVVAVYTAPRLDVGK